MEKISIIVPVYNTEPYLKRCVDSLLHQTYASIEILLIDDGSTDNSLEVCREYERKDDRIHVYYSAMYCGQETTRNCGQETTRNCGLENATGKWIMFLDSDDEYTPDAVEKMAVFASKTNADVVFASYTAIKNGEESIEKATIEDGVYTQQQFASICLSKIPWHMMSCIGSKIYKRSYIEDNKFKFDRYFKFNEDGAFMLQSIMHSDRIGYIDFPFYQYYMRNSGSIQSSYRDGMFEFISRTNGLLKSFLIDNHEYYGVQETAYFKQQASLFLSSLENEAHFGSFAGWKKVFKELREHESFKEMIQQVDALSRMQRIMVNCLRFKLCLMFYVLMRCVIWKHGRYISEE